MTVSPGFSSPFSSASRKEVGKEYQKKSMTIFDGGTVQDQHFSLFTIDWISEQVLRCSRAGRDGAVQTMSKRLSEHTGRWSERGRKEGRKGIREERGASESASEIFRFEWRGMERQRRRTVPVMMPRASRSLTDESGLKNSHLA